MCPILIPWNILLLVQTKITSINVCKENFKHHIDSFKSSNCELQHSHQFWRFKPIYERVKNFFWRFSEPEITFFMFIRVLESGLHSVKTDGIQSFQFGNQKKTRDRQQRSISRSKLEIDFESRWSNAIWLVTVKRSKSCDTISFVKLHWQFLTRF